MTGPTDPLEPEPTENTVNLDQQGEVPDSDLRVPGFDPVPDALLHGPVPAELVLPDQVDGVPTSDLQVPGFDSYLDFETHFPWGPTKFRWISKSPEHGRTVAFGVAALIINISMAIVILASDELFAAVLAVLDVALLYFWLRGRGDR